MVICSVLQATLAHDIHRVLLTLTLDGVGTGGILTSYTDVGVILVLRTGIRCR